eukprot:Gb_16206 [translate_table: standard]
MPSPTILACLLIRANLFAFPTSSPAPTTSSPTLSTTARASAPFAVPFSNFFHSLCIFFHASALCNSPPSPSNLGVTSPNPSVSSPTRPAGGVFAGPIASGASAQTPNASDSSYVVAAFMPSTPLVLVGLALVSIHW